MSCNASTVVSCSDGTLCHLLQAGPLKISHRTIINTNGATVIQWDLNSIIDMMALPGPVSLVETKLQWSHVDVPELDAWTDLYSYTQADSGIYTTTAPLLRGHEYTTHFRMGLRVNSADIYYTRPQRVLDHIPYSQQSAYRDIVSRWHEQCRQGAYRLGYLLKRVRWGDLCPNCIDRDGEHAIKSQCPTCYGSTFALGFIQADGCFYFKCSPSEQQETFDTQRGHKQSGPVMESLWLNIPDVYCGDVLVDHYTDEKWLIGSKLTNVVRIGGCELIRKAPTIRLDASDILHAFPVQRKA